MLHDVEGVLSKSAILAEIDSKRAIADDDTDAIIKIEAVGGDRLPRELAASAETTDIP